MNHNILSVWQGVFDSFESAEGNMDAFETDIWLEKQKNKIFRALTDFEKGEAVSRDYPIPLVITMLLSQKQHVSVLDFGGGMGFQYLDLISKVPDAKEKVDYYVVEGNATLKNRPAELEQFTNLRFYADFNQIKTPISIIHIGSTLQYIEKWQDLLDDLITKFHPDYFIFSDLLAGEIPEFVSHQIFYDKKIPVNMLNAGNFIKFLNGKFYRVIYKTLFQANILGSKNLPNNALPEDYRLQMTLNLIFENINMHK